MAVGQVKLNGGGTLKADKEKLFELLLEKTRELGRMLSPEDARSDPNFPNPNEYAYDYGSFDKAAERAFSKVEFEKEFPNGLPSDESDEHRIGVYSSAAAQRKGFEKMSPKRRRVLSRRTKARTYTDEKILEIVEALYDELGRMPSRQEYLNFHKRMPEITPANITIGARFHTWSNVERVIEKRKLERARQEVAEMAKKEDKVGYSAELREQYIELVLDMWEKRKKMPSRRAIEKNSMVKFHKLLEPFNGSYAELEKAVERAARERGLISDEEPEGEVASTSEAELTPEVEPVSETVDESDLIVESEVKKMAKKRFFNREKALQDLKRYYEENGRLPRTVDLAVPMERYPELMQYTTMLNHLGPISGWLELIGVKEEPEEAEEKAEALPDDVGVAADDEPRPDTGAEEEPGEITPAEAMLTTNAALNQFVDSLSEKLKIEDAEIEVILSIKGLRNPILVKMEF